MSGTSGTIAPTCFDIWKFAMRIWVPDSVATTAVEKQTRWSQITLKFRNSPQDSSSIRHKSSFLPYNQSTRSPKPSKPLAPQETFVSSLLNTLLSRVNCSVHKSVFFFHLHQQQGLNFSVTPCTCSCWTRSCYCKNRCQRCYVTDTHALEAHCIPSPA